MENPINRNIQNDKEQEISFPVSADKYKETLKNISREDIISGLVANGASQEEAEEMADEFDQDR